MSKINFLHSVIFLGTGASSSLPNVLCITREKSGCKVCPSALTEEGKRNRRRNCSLLVRWYDGEGKLRNILIDCGKTFFEASLAFLAPLKITTIDAVILTHGHADAMFGLDDLRSWSWMKEGGIPVYLSQSTMDVVSSAFPYLVDRNKATGGGEVPTLRFKVINEHKNFTVEGLEFTPINVEHGVQHGCQAYMSLGFRFKNVTYLSDVSKIPDEVRNRLDGTKLLIIDCLRELYYPSHYGFQEAIGEVIKYKPLNTYFVGMGHSLDHEEFSKRCQKVSASKFPGHSIQPAYDGLSLEFLDTIQKEFNLSSLN